MTHNFCSHCGEKVTIEGKFCAGCGQSLTMVDMNKQASFRESAVPPITTRKKGNKWIYIIIAAIIVIIAYIFFIKSTPEKVAEEFVVSLFEFDFEKSLDLIAFSADEDVKEEFEWLLEETRYDPKGAREELREMREEGYTLEKFIVRDKRQTKYSATLTVDMILKNGDKDSGYIELIKESGKWKIYDID